MLIFQKTSSLRSLTIDKSVSLKWGSNSLMSVLYDIKLPVITPYAKAKSKNDGLVFLGLSAVTTAIENALKPPFGLSPPPTPTGGHVYGVVQITNNTTTPVSTI